MGQNDLHGLKRGLEDIPWVPVVSEDPGASNLLPVREAFDPNCHVLQFTTAASKRAALESDLSDFNAEEAAPAAIILIQMCSPKKSNINRSLTSFLTACAQVDEIWQVLRQCGLKHQMTWEDVVQEAEHIAQAKDIKTSEALFRYISENCGCILGDKAEAMKRLQNVMWVKAQGPQDPQQTRGADVPLLEAPSQLFSAECRDVVWAVSPTLHETLPPSAVVQANRSIAREPQAPALHEE